MPLADKIEELLIEKNKPNNFCAYKAMYDALAPKDQKALDEAWQKGYSVNIVLTALRAEGIKSSNESIRAHRKGMCKCLKN
jgi:TRAP-type C4-dicarboxylate transport system substrate-binding protein